VEATSKFEVLHGEAVAIGMAHEARLAERLGIAEAGTATRLTRVLESYGLPLDLPGSAARLEDLLTVMRQDKKTRAGQIRFALPRSIGTMHQTGGSWTVPVSEAAVRDVLADSASVNQ
jgi:3-dehydroquinate synthase